MSQTYKVAEWFFFSMEIQCLKSQWNACGFVWKWSWEMLVSCVDVDPVMYDTSECFMRFKNANKWTHQSNCCCCYYCDVIRSLFFFEWLIFFWLSLFIKSRHTKRRIHVRNSGVWQNVRNCLTHDWHKKTVSKLSQELRFIQGY